MLNNFIKRFITSLILILVLSFGLFYNEISWKLLVMIFSVICFFEFYNLLKKISINIILKILINLLIVFYLYFFYLLLIKIKTDFGEEIILILLISCIFSDIGGYIVGKFIRGPKLTSISPNKTISGALGSIIFTIIGTSIFLFLLNTIYESSISLEISYLSFTWMIMMSIYCQVGDLFVSYLKRKAKVKDTGNILPGHGGILDRVDGIIFAIPFGVLTYFILMPK